MPAFAAAQQKAPSSLTGLGDNPFQYIRETGREVLFPEGSGGLFRYIRETAVLNFCAARRHRQDRATRLIASLEKRQIFRAGLAAHLVRLGFKRNFLSFGKAGQASPLDSADVNEHIGAAIARLNETEALLAVEPLHSTSRHNNNP